MSFFFPGNGNENASAQRWAAESERTVGGAWLAGSIVVVLL